MLDAILWVLAGLWGGVAGMTYVLWNARTVFDLSDPEAVFRLIYYGASTELFFAVFILVALLFAAGVRHRPLLWGVVRGGEAGLNGLGRIVAWAGLLMVLQQVMVVFLRAIFRVSEISISPLGLDVGFPLGWWSDSLKVYNAAIIALCCGWTFVQGGHVRVDLVYGAVRFRTKRAIDMAGALLFMIPSVALIYYYAWFFMWRHLVTPKVSASEPLDRMLLKARAFRWTVETTGFSPNGFNAYFLFKVLMVVFCLTMLVHAVLFFFRAFLEFTEGEAAAGRHHDADDLGPVGAPMAADAQATSERGGVT